MRNRFAFVGVGAVACMLWTSAQGATWLNETDTPGEMDWCNIQWPYSFSLNAGESANVYGRVYEAGVTDAFGPTSIVAQVGYGVSGSDPRTSTWTWIPGAFNTEYGPEDEYYANIACPPAGLYSYTFRYSQDGGSSWTLGDLDGAGSNSGQTFEVSQLGALEAVPEPATFGTGLMVTSAIALRRRRYGDR